MFAFEKGSGASDRWRPDPRFDDPDFLGRTLTRRVLPLVSSPARYIGGELGADRHGFDPAGANILLTFPDAYEVGMSHQGLRILYSLLQDKPHTFCDLAYTPWPDMEQMMRAEGLPLFGLESRRPAGLFDIVGFSLGYELAYTNMLTMIDLVGSPLRADDRGEDDPLFIAGGSCTLNPAVVSPFLDLILLGDGEEGVLDAAAVVTEMKAAGASRAETLARLREIDGAWWPGVTRPVRARVLKDLNTFPPPAQLVPVMEPVHDRLALEVMRGCVRGCRFCQAGMITRPVRERDAAALVQAAAEGVADAGYAEVSLLSLSTSDYSGLGETVVGIQNHFQGQRTNLALPSLRVDSVDEGLYSRISQERPGSFTFAPEAGSQRLRDVINKNITEDDIVTTARQAFESGVKGVKLYFMIGLPTETNEDLDELVALVGKIVALAPRGGSQIHVSVSPFAPKVHTPFQWAGQISRAEIDRRNNYLARPLRRLKVKVSLREPHTSFLEGLLGLGDEGLTPVVQRAWELGARFDGWTEHFRIELWDQALEEAGVDLEGYLAPRDPEVPLPWDTVDAGVDKAFLQRDWRRATRARILPDCRLEGACYDCSSCDGDMVHIFAKLEALQGAEPRRGPAIPTKGRQGTQERIAPASPTPAAGDPETPQGPEFDLRNADDAKPGQEERKWQIWRQQAAAKCWYRIEFEKSGDMVFLGHLDFQRQLHLALRRSGLPAAYSKGYHPHPLLKFGPPLPVGVVGLRECLDIALERQVPGWIEEVNRTLPPGLKILRDAVVGGQTPRSIDQIVTRMDYRVALPGSEEGGPAYRTVAAAVDAFLASDKWLHVRKRPKGDIELDARKLVATCELGPLNSIEAGEGPVLRVSLLRSKTGASLPVHDFLTALLAEALPEPGHCAITRTGYFGRHADGRWLSPIEEVGESSLRYWMGRHMIG
ncbi:MAG: TIGR03936 family radical SAM-associated protein [Candidatus Krumholzibacteriota bacterium]